MAIWYPPPAVGEKELIGRRLLDKSGEERVADEDGRPLYDLSDFYETREESDLSVDRLGDPNPGRDTVRAISRLAEEEVSRPGTNRSFNGWATIRVQNLRFPGWIGRVTASPTRDEAGAAQNYWHADVSRDGFRDRAHAYTLAITLRDTFASKGTYQPPEQS